MSFGVLAQRPNPQLEDQGVPLPVWQSTPYATAGIALRVVSVSKFPHLGKVTATSGKAVEFIHCQN